MKKIIYPILISILSFAICYNFFSYQQSMLIAILTLLVSLWTNEGLPIGVVSLLPIIMFPSFDIISINDTAPNYSKSIIFLFLGGFLLSIATQKLDLHKYISTKILSVFPNNPMGLILGLSFTTMFLSSLISNTTACLLILPIAVFITDNKDLKLRLILSVAYGANIGGIITPIGTPPNLIFMGFMENNEIVNNISFIKWVLLTAPLAFVMIFVMSFFISRTVKDIKITKTKTQNKKLNPSQKKLMYILLSLIILLIINSPIEPYYSGLKLNEKIILLAYGILMFIPKIGNLKWEDTKKIPYEIIFLLGAGFSIATAFSKTGLAEEIASRLTAISYMPLILIIIIIAAMVTFTTEITSNTALTSISLPIIYSISQKSDNIQPELLLFVATIAASYSFMLPISTPPNAIAMSYKVMRLKYMAKTGFFMNIIGISFISIVAYLIWRFYL